MRLYAVVGKPVLLCRGPELLKPAFDLTGTDAVFMRLAANDAASALTTARKMGLSGLEVASPFKESMAALVDELDPAAARLGAVNYVTLHDGRAFGHQTDVDGVNRLVGHASSWQGFGLYLAGFMGVGKTTVGRLLAERLGLAFKDIDDEIEQEAGQSVMALFETVGEKTFRRLEAIAARRLRAGTVTALGGGALVDPTTAEQLREHGLVIWLWASPETLSGRGVGEGRPLWSANDKIMGSLLAERVPSYARTAAMVVDAEAPPSDVVDLIIAELDAAGLC